MVTYRQEKEYLLNKWVVGYFLGVFLLFNHNTTFVVIYCCAHFIGDSIHTQSDLLKLKSTAEVGDTKSNRTWAPLLF